MTTGLFSAVGQATNNLGPFAPTYQQAFQITTAQLRTLNSVPVTLVMPPNGTSIVVPLEWIQASNVGSVPFSDIIEPQLILGGLSPGTGTSFDGSAVVVVPNAQPFAGDYAAGSAIGQPLQINSGGSDVTDGDGTTLTLIVTYQVMDLDGLI